MQETAPVLNEIGVGELSVEVATDHDAALKSVVKRDLTASLARDYHWRNFLEARPGKRHRESRLHHERRVYANWLALERHCNARIALEFPFWIFGGTCL